MKILFRFTVLLSLLSLNSALSQDYHGIVFPQQNRDQICRNFKQRFNNKPVEVRFSIQREGTKLYFSTNHKEWFKSLLKS